MTTTKATFFFAAIVLVIVPAIFPSCQKELDPEAYNTCLPEKIEVFENGSSSAAEIYSYVYDPTTLWPRTITISLPGTAFTRVIDVFLRGDTINLGSVGYIELDNSNRITHFSVRQAIPGAEKGDYFYGYNSEGFLAERLFDDGSSLVERAIFTNNGGAIDSFTFSYEFNPEKLMGSIQYLPVVNGNGENLLPYTDIFPELLPFAYLVRLGRLSLELPNRMQVIFQSPGQPEIDIQYQYNGYQFDAENLLTGFSSLVSLPGFPDYQRRFNITYLCQ